MCKSVNYISMRVINCQDKTGQARINKRHPLRHHAVQQQFGLHPLLFQLASSLKYLHLQIIREAVQFVHYRVNDVEISVRRHDKHQPSTHGCIEATETSQQNHAAIRYDTRCCFKVRSKSDISQLNLPHGTKN